MLQTTKIENTSSTSLQRKIEKGRTQVILFWVHYSICDKIRCTYKPEEKKKKFAAWIQRCLLYICTL